MFITAIFVLFLIKKIKASNKNDEFLLLFTVLLALFFSPLSSRFSDTLLRGSQWGGGFYGYRLKFWLFYGYRLIFFSYG